MYDVAAPGFELYRSGRLECRVGASGDTKVPSTVTEHTIAIVDDDDEVRDALSGPMRSLGYGVRCYASATDFLEDKTNPARTA